MTLSAPIGSRLKARLGNILTANGYRTDAGQNMALDWRHQDNS
ncbi:hypothetical protein [Nitrosococcus wardiae]|nr:hypothetical protein [Nitrosococcus wardiae]